MREFDESCLSVPTPLARRQIKALRERLHVSQPISARYLNTSESTVEKVGDRCQKSPVEWRLNYWRSSRSTESVLG